MLELLLVMVCILSIAACCVGCVVFLCVGHACRKRQEKRHHGRSRDDVMSVSVNNEMRFQISDEDLDAPLTPRDEDSNHALYDYDYDEVHGHHAHEGMSRTDTNDRGNEDLYGLTLERRLRQTARPPPRISRRQRTPRPPPRKHDEEEKQEELCVMAGLTVE